MAEKFRFRKQHYIGASDAEEDIEFLSKCFINTGDVELLSNCERPERIVLGRTGTGKTALLFELIKRKNVIEIRPESLSFSYIVNSNILQFFFESGAKLDLFFRLLWRHVFTVELLKLRYNIKSEKEKNTFLSSLSKILTRDKKKERAVNYLLKWGETFWEETEYRIKETTKKIEKDLGSSLKGKIKDVGFSLEGAKRLSEEERAEITNRGQQVINSIQMRELSEILDFLNEDVFDDNQQNFEEG